MNNGKTTEMANGPWEGRKTPEIRQAAVFRPPRLKKPSLARKWASMTLKTASLALKTAKNLVKIALTGLITHERKNRAFLGPLRAS